MFSHLKLKQRIFSGYFLPLILFIFLGLAVYNSVRERQKLSKQITLSQQIIIELDESVLGLSRMVRNVRGQVLFPNDTSYQESYQSGLDLYLKATEELDGLIEDPLKQEKLEVLISEADTHQAIARQVFNLVTNDELEAAKRLTQEMRMSQIDSTHAEILAQERRALEDYAQAEEAALNMLMLTIIFGTGASAIITSVTGLGIAGWITKAINQAVSVATNFSNNINVTLEQQEKISAQQASAVNQTTTTMDELGASSQQSTQQVEAAAQAAQQALQLTEGGTEAVEKTLETMAELKEKVTAIAQEILRLNEQTGQIGNISDLVSDLANQTNMLALNAAVEAVKAGEHGKGFGVVATEIRKLADQSRQSAEKINSLVADVQKAIHSTRRVTNEGTQSVDKGVKITQSTADAFAGVAESVNNVVMNNQQVTFNIQQQALAIQQVIEAINSLNQGARETANGIRDSRLETQQLSKAMLSLKQIL